MRNNKIESFRDENSMGFIIQAKGLKKSYALLLFTLLWNAFSWFLFSLMLTENDPRALLFSLPFLLVGIVTFISFLFSWKGSFSLLIDDSKCHGIWSVFNYKFKRTLIRDKITDISAEVLYTQNKRPIYGIVINAEKRKKLKFGSAMTQQEREQYIDELKSFLKLKRGNE